MSSLLIVPVLKTWRFRVIGLVVWLFYMIEMLILLFAHYADSGKNFKVCFQIKINFRGN